MNLKNPYKEIAYPHRLNVVVSKEDVWLITSVIPDHGALQAMVATFINSLANECRHYEWSLAEREQLIKQVNERCAPSWASQSEPNSDERGGTQGVRTPDARDTDKRSDRPRDAAQKTKKPFPD